MAKIAYQSINISPDRLELIQTCNEIIREYQQDDLMLTLRQLYYQLVSRDVIANRVQEYKRLGDVVNAARLAGLMDWSAIEDRTRNLVYGAHWDNPESILAACASQFRVDRWEDQDNHVECFPPETPVRTPDGPTAIGAIVVGDWVISGKGVGRRVEQVFRKPYRGDMVCITAAGVPPLMCTPEHPVWFQATDTRVPGYKGADRRFLPPAYLPARELTVNGLLRVPRLKGVYPQTTVRLTPGPRSYDPGEVPVNDAFLTMLGFYLAEGCVKTDGRTVQFTFSHDEPHFAAEVCAWAESVGFHPFTRAGAGTCIVYVCGRALAQWLATQFGSGSRNKHLPSWCLGLPQEQQLVLLKAYVQGDGHWADPSRSAITVTSFSEALAQDVQTVLLRCGFAAALSRTKDHGWMRCQVTVGGASGKSLADRWGFQLAPKGLGRAARYNHIKLDEDYAYFPVRSVTTVPYEGEVCNLEVSLDHTYCVPIEVHNCWVEKEALSGVFERICRTMDVGCFACRGYTSQSEMWAASQRFLEHIRNGKSVVILHFGDHDPSGIDMSRDIEDRLRMFLSHHLGSARVDEAFVVKRLALNMDQVRRYQPPENPAKSTDSRFASYHATYGDKSWELDALNPRTLQALVREHVMELCDKDLWEDIITREAEARGQLRTMTAHYTEILEHMMEDKNLSSSLTEHVDEARTRITDELNGGADEGDE